MEIIKNTLALVVSTPDEPIGACKFVSSVTGYILLNLSPEDVREMVTDYVNSKTIATGIPSLEVTHWAIPAKGKPYTITFALEVGEFAATPPDPDDDKPENYEWA